MSLVREIQKDAISDEVQLSSLLRKCLMLATRLDSEELRGWARSELNGYVDKADLPPYRVLTKQVRGTLSTRAESARDVPLLIYDLSDDIRELLTTALVFDPIASIERMTQTSGASVRLAIPAEIVLLISRRYPRGVGCINAYMLMAVNDLIGVLDTVRTRVLDFALEIERQYPATAKDDSALALDPKTQHIGQLFLTLIMGENAGSMSIGNKTEQHVTDSTVGAVAQGDGSGAKHGGGE